MDWKIHCGIEVLTVLDLSNASLEGLLVKVKDR
jgi:hypothetical protein